MVDQETAFWRGVFFFLRTFFLVCSILNIILLMKSLSMGFNEVDVTILVRFHVGMTLSCTLPLVVDIYYMRRFTTHIFGDPGWSTLLYFWYLAVRSPLEMKLWAENMGDSVRTVRSVHQSFRQSARDLGLSGKCHRLVLLGEYPEALRMTALALRQDARAEMDQILLRHAGRFGLTQKMQALIHSCGSGTTALALGRKSQAREAATKRTQEQHERQLARVRARAHEFDLAQEVDNLLKSDGIQGAQQFLDEWSHHRSLLGQAERYGCTAEVRALLLCGEVQSANDLVEHHTQVHKTVVDAQELGLKFKPSALLQDQTALENAHHAITKQREALRREEQMNVLTARVEAIPAEHCIRAGVHEALQAVKNAMSDKTYRLALRGLELAINRAMQAKKQRHR